MHPAIGILTLVTLAACLPSLSLSWLFGTWLLLCIALRGTQGARVWSAYLGTAARLRWLLLAIVVLYVGFTRDAPIWDALPGIGRAGLIEGSRRALVLLVLLAAVHHLMAQVTAPRLASGLCVLLVPLQPLGVNPERAARRLALTLEQARAGALPGAESSGVFERAVAALIHTEQQAVGSTTAAGSPLPTLGHPPAWQWLLPPLPLYLAWLIT